MPEQTMNAGRRRLLLWGASMAYLAILVCLCLSSTLRVTGDGKEYLLLTERFAAGDGPAIPVAEAASGGVFDPKLIDRYGAQQLWHFWFFPLLVAPLVGTFGGHAAAAFAIANVVLLVLAFNVVHRRFDLWAAVFVGCSPVLWWVDKPQVETFSVATIAVGCALIDRPHIAALAFGLAATQNPPFAAVALALCLIATFRQGADTRASVWFSCAIAVLLAVMHPLYYWTRLGRWTPLVDSSDARIPAMRTLLTVVTDLNVGMIVNMPMVFVILGAAVLAGARNSRERAPGATGRLGLLVGLFAWFSIAFAQAPNVNSGGTPGMTRYALWFVPLPLLLWSCSRRRSVIARMVPALVCISTIWNLAFFRPSLSESYLWPTGIAAWVWTNHPSWENPLPEIFAERLRHQDGVNTLAAVPGCSKALLQGGQWPQPCPPVVVPAKCQGPGALCYANRRRDGEYDFVETSRRGGIRISTILP